MFSTLPIFGYVSLTIALISAIFLPKKPIYNFLASTCALLILALCYVNSNFALQSIYLNSNYHLPIAYKIAGIWSNAEGSLLFWIWILSFYNITYNFSTPSSFTHKSTTLQVQSALIVGFTALLILIYNPFKTLKISPLEGLGLNPALQDIALTIHPPFLYLGYLGYSILFSLSIAILLESRINSIHLLELKKWNIIAWSFLTLGITLGAWWAYRELGWGGFWFWDPVENISILPWLLSTALLHLSVIKIPKTNLLLFLGLMPFLSAVFGTFLVRSGILESVHSFTDSPDKGICLLLLFSLLFISSFTIFLINYRKFNNNLFVFSALSHKERGIFIGCIAFIVFFIVLLIGICTPLLAGILYKQTIFISANYYNKLLIIFTIFCLIICLLTYVNPKLSYFYNFQKYNIPLLLTSIITLQTSYYFKSFDFLLLIFLCSLQIIILIQKLAINNFKLPFRSLGMFFGHLGVLLLILGVTLTSFLTKSLDKYISVGETLRIENYSIVLKELKIINDANYQAIQGVFAINNTFYLKPETRLYTLTNRGNAEAAILHRYFADLYILISEINPIKGVAVQIYYRPFISWIWIGGFLIFLSGIFVFISIWQSKYTNAPLLNEN